MSAKNCCKTIEKELTAWKANVNDISRKMQNTSGETKGSIISHLGDLHILMEEMDERIEEIRESCSPKTGMEDILTLREKYDHALVNVRMNPDEAMAVIGAGNFGG